MSDKINKHNVHDYQVSAKSINTYDLFILNALARDNYKKQNEFYELMNLTYHQHLQQDLNHFENFDYLDTKLNERKYLDKEYLSRSSTSSNSSNDFTLKDKINYYSKRVNDKKLSEQQRRYAQNFLNKNK